MLIDKGFIQWGTRLSSKPGNLPLPYSRASAHAASWNPTNTKSSPTPIGPVLFIDFFSVIPIPCKGLLQAFWQWYGFLWKLILGRNIQGVFVIQRITFSIRFRNIRP